MFVAVLPIALAALINRRPQAGRRGRAGQPTARPAVGGAPVPAFGGIVFGLSRLGADAATSGRLAIASAWWSACSACCSSADASGCWPAAGDPLLDLRAFGYPMFRLGTIVLCISMIALFGMIILLRIYLQSIRGTGLAGNRLVAAAGRRPDGRARAGRRPAAGSVRPAGARRPAVRALLTAGACGSSAASMRPPRSGGCSRCTWRPWSAWPVVHPVLHHRAEPAAASTSTRTAARSSPPCSRSPAQQEPPSWS